jgi:hypothetical protein
VRFLARNAPTLQPKLFLTIIQAVVLWIFIATLMLRNKVLENNVDSQQAKMGRYELPFL